MRFIILISIFWSLFYCSSASTTVKSSPKKEEVAGAKIYSPGGESEKVFNEKGEEVTIVDSDPEFFKAPSKDSQEFFRVIVSSDSYQLRQIRGSDQIKRAVDLGGDSLIMEEIQKFDLINYMDDGIIAVKLSAYTGKLENVNFYTRPMRINDLAKITQNDATRWNFIHANPAEPAIQQFRIYYQVVLKNKNKTTKEEIINKIKK